MHRVVLLLRRGIVLALLLLAGPPGRTQPPPAALPARPGAGPGVQICEPVASGSGSEIAALGSGCTLWLQWALGFEPELGRTPRWAEAARVMRERHAADMRFTEAQAPQLAGLLGVTHAVTGKMSGDRLRCTLTYRLFDLPAMHALGDPIRMSGTREEVIAALPKTARTIAARLGARTLRLPVRTGLTPADAALLGRYGWGKDLEAPSPLQDRVDHIAARAPFAAFLSLAHRVAGALPDDAAASLRLLDRMPSNFLAIGAVAYLFPRPPDDVGRRVDACAAAIRAPDNAVLAAWAAQRGPSPEARVEGYERVVRLASEAPTGWYLLAWHCQEQYGAVRRGRALDQMSKEETDNVTEIGIRAAYAARRAVAIDPLYRDAWLALLMAAGELGGQTTARDAFERACALDSGYTYVYREGLVYFQPKWGGDREMLARVARLAADASFPPHTNISFLERELTSLGFTDEAARLRANAAARTAAAAHPVSRADPTTPAGRDKPPQR